MGKITFITTLSSGHQPNSWDLPQYHVMAIKPDAGKKFIAYYKGEDTIYTEEMYIKNKDIKPSKIPSFEYNELHKRTELNVDDSDTNLVLYLKSHPWFGKKFNITNKELEANNKLSSFVKVEQALELIKEAGADEVKATAVAVLGFNYFSKTNAECTADLKERAFKNPDDIITTMKASDYEARYISSVAFCENIIESNPTSTAIVWADNKGIIIHVAKGENGMNKLAEFLNSNTAESEAVLQEFGIRVDKLKKQKADEKFDPSAVKKELSDKDKEIAELKAMLAANAGTPEPEEPKKEYNTIEEAIAAYKEQKGEDVPVAKANNLNWIVKQLS